MLLSSFVYALYQMNVFQAGPHFLLGMVLALLVLRTGSVGSAIVFHLVWELLLRGPLVEPELFRVVAWLQGSPLSEWGMVLICLVLAAPILSALGHPLFALRRKEEAEGDKRKLTNPSQE